MCQSQKIQSVFNNWEYYTLAADACYHRAEYKEASQTFCRTVDLLEPWLDRDHKQLWKVMRLFVLSCHNAAHALSKLGRHKEAEYYYSHAHFRLLSFVSHHKNSYSIMEHVLLELRATFSMLTQYLMGKNKQELAENIREESLRVIRQSYFSYVDDLFTQDYLCEDQKAVG